MPNPAWDLSASPEDYAVSAEFLADKTSISADEFYSLASEARRKAFTVSQIHDLDLIQSILDSLDVAVKQGTSLESWKSLVGPGIKAVWGDLA